MNSTQEKWINLTGDSKFKIQALIDEAGKLRFKFSLDGSIPEFTSQDLRHLLAAVEKFEEAFNETKLTAKEKGLQLIQFEKAAENTPIKTVETKEPTSGAELARHRWETCRQQLETLEAAGETNSAEAVQLRDDMRQAMTALMYAGGR